MKKTADEKKRTKKNADGKKPKRYESGKKAIMGKCEKGGEREPSEKTSIHRRREQDIHRKRHLIIGGEERYLSEKT